MCSHNSSATAVRSLGFRMPPWLAAAAATQPRHKRGQRAGAGQLTGRGPSTEDSGALRGESGGTMGESEKGRLGALGTRSLDSFVRRGSDL